MLVWVLEGGDAEVEEVEDWKGVMLGWGGVMLRWDRTGVKMGARLGNVMG